MGYKKGTSKQRGGWGWADSGKGIQEVKNIMSKGCKGWRVLAAHIPDRNISRLEKHRKYSSSSLSLKSLPISLSLSPFLLSLASVSMFCTDFCTCLGYLFLDLKTSPFLLLSQICTKNAAILNQQTSIIKY